MRTNPAIVAELMSTTAIQTNWQLKLMVEELSKPLVLPDVEIGGLAQTNELA